MYFPIFLVPVALAATVGARQMVEPCMQISQVMSSATGSNGPLWENHPTRIITDDCSSHFGTAWCATTRIITEDSTSPNGWFGASMLDVHAFRATSGDWFSRRFPQDTWIPLNYRHSQKYDTLTLYLWNKRGLTTINRSSTGLPDAIDWSSWGRRWNLEKS